MRSPIFKPGSFCKHAHPKHSVPRIGLTDAWFEAGFWVYMCTNFPSASVCRLNIRMQHRRLTKKKPHIIIFARRSRYHLLFLHDHWLSFYLSAQAPKWEEKFPPLPSSSCSLIALSDLAYFAHFSFNFSLHFYSFDKPFSHLMHISSPLSSVHSILPLFCTRNENRRSCAKLLIAH